MAVTDIVGAVADIVGAVTGIIAAPDWPPDGQGSFPLAITYCPLGDWQNQAGTKRGLIDVWVDILYPMADMATAWAVLTPYIDSISSAILKATSLSSTVDAMAGLSHQVLQSQYQDIPVLVLRIIVRGCKLRVAL